MAGIEDFSAYLKSNQRRLALIIACSGTKRDDRQIEALLDYAPIRLTNLSDFSSSYRDCASCYRNVLYPSEAYPAYLRYYGHFYKQIPLSLWEKTENWHILILSAYYGLIRLTDKICNYNLSMGKVKAACKNRLRIILKKYMQKHNLEEAIFFASDAYFSPFKEMPEAKRLYIYKNNTLVSGPYGRDFYTACGKIFASVLRGEVDEEVKEFKVELGSKFFLMT